jgi:DNA polymerase elongation subunit (family B)
MSDFKQDEKKDSKQSSIQPTVVKKYVQRTDDYSFDNISGRYKSIKGKAFLNPKPTDQIPKLHNRAASYRLYAEAKEFVFYFTNPEPLVDDIYITGVCNNGATLALKLLNLSPFWYSSIQEELINDDNDRPSDFHAEELRVYLNQRQFWPRNFEVNKNDVNKLPIVSIEIEARKSTHYIGVDKTGKRKSMWVYKYNFLNMSCWRHYRDLLTPLRSHIRDKNPDKWGNALNKAFLDWQPEMHHERSFYTYIQMLWNSNPIAPKTWLQIDTSKCKWIAPDAPDSFGGHSDNTWTEEDLETAEADAEIEFQKYNELKTRLDNNEINEDDSSDSGSSDEDDDDSDEEDDDNSESEQDKEQEQQETANSGKRKWIQKKRRTKQKLQRLRKRCQRKLEKIKEYLANHRRTRCILEGAIDYRELTKRPDIVGGGPVCQAFFDIETASGKQIQYTLQGGIKPPWPDDENKIDSRYEQPMDKLEDYADLLSKMKSLAITEEELEATLPPLGKSDEKMSNVNKRWFAGAKGKKRRISVDTRQKSIFSFVTQKQKTDEETEQQRQLNLQKRKDLQNQIDEREEKERELRLLKKKKLASSSSSFSSSSISSSSSSASSSSSISAASSAVSSSSSSSSSSFERQDTKDAKANDNKQDEKEYKPMHVFPDPNNAEDPITYIATKFMIYGDDEPFLTVIHSLRTATERKELKDAVKFRWSKPTYENEWSLLSHWSHMIASQMDIEFLWQYNGIGYDIPYMAIRAKYLNCRRFNRLGRFLALPLDELLDEDRFKRCCNCFKPRIGRSIHRRDQYGNEKEDIDFPGVRIQIPGLLMMDAYKIIRQMTFNSLEFGTLKEVTKKFTKCRCKGYIQPDNDTIEMKQNLCARCGHARKLHCRVFLLPENKSDSCKNCGMKSKDHSVEKDPCRSKQGPRKRDLKGVLITPFYCTNDDSRAVEEWYCEQDVDSTLEVAYQNQMFPGQTELSCITRTGIDDLMNRGTTKKTWNQLVFESHHGNWLLDERWRQHMQKRYRVPTDDVPEYAKSQEERREQIEIENAKTKAQRATERIKYQGGYVIDPRPGVKNCIVNTLDWNSLYPSIIINNVLDWANWMDHDYDEEGRLFLTLYGKTYQEFKRNERCYKIWRLEDLKPTPEEVGNRDLILVVDDWGDVDAARWIAYQLWLKLYAQKAARAPHSYDSNGNPKANKHAKLPWSMTNLPPGIKHWKPLPGQKPRMTCCFVVNRESMFLPILKNLLDGRSRVKKLQKDAENRGDYFMGGVYEAQQLALKLCGNGAYGFTGAVKGFFGAVPIAAATCLIGRHYIILSAITSDLEFDGPPIYGGTS